MPIPLDLVAAFDNLFNDDSDSERLLVLLLLECGPTAVSELSINGLGAMQLLGQRNIIKVTDVAVLSGRADALRLHDEFRDYAALRKQRWLDDLQMWSEEEGGHVQVTVDGLFEMTLRLRGRGEAT